MVSGYINVNTANIGSSSCDRDYQIGVRKLSTKREAKVSKVA